MFLAHACEVLSDCFTGSNMVKFMVSHALKHDITIPYHQSPLAAPNKRTGMLENLKAFPAHLQFAILKQLCNERRTVSQVNEVRERLLANYSHLAEEKPGETVSQAVIAETKHWLQDHADSLQVYTSAEQKYQAKQNPRNLLDDLRLSLELLLKSVLANDRPLEKQTPAFGEFLKNKGCAVELRNMLVTLLDYYGKYQNSYVKHDSAVNEEELEIVFRNHFIVYEASGPDVRAVLTHSL